MIIELTSKHSISYPRQEADKCLVGLDAIVCKMSDIMNNAESDSQDALFKFTNL
jgi:hypothetical protein